MLTFLPCNLRLTSKPIDLPSVVAMIAAAKEGDWVNNSADARAWSPKAAAALDDARHSLLDVLASGGLTAYVYLEEKDAFRVVPVAYWSDDKPPVTNWVDDRPVTRVRNEGHGEDRLGTRIFAFDTRLPPGIGDCPVLVLEEDVRAFLRFEASAEQRARRVPDSELRQWFEGYRTENDIEAVSVDGVIVPAAEAFFAGRTSGIRRRIRTWSGEINPNRKGGPKPLR